MREIKFRYWNGITNQMVCDPMIRAEYEFSLSEYMNTDRGWQWMQFTGLHDKNGKEIYEGDIVKWLPDYIKISESPKIVAYVGSGYYPFQYDGGGEYAAEDCEVIGNIYERYSAES